ncbi:MULTISPECIES: alpha/beta hydrolase [unclassified Streptomyces]|uniref:alpha/beta fold hydrolase n=1 Tax=unclassified Streptomyces TaxID=2593676 RepID=UPI00036BCE65|nr:MULTISPECIES: alpha/beta hydrolase [unclassified Streptomyces]MYX37121.1 alpha/beta fold hydrolase [Streptomyces sp. SID8377]
MSHRRPVRRVRLAVVGAVGLALAAGLATTASATQERHTKPAGKPAPKPTVVLVHGAWADSAGWTGVAKRLQADGYPVAAPATPLRGLAGDAAYLADYLRTIKGPVVLVGHSYGGAVITGAATGNADVKALVYVAAFAPDKGESIADLVGRFPGSHLSDDPNAPVPTALNAVPFTQADGGTGVDLYIKPDKFRDVFLSDRVSRSKAAVLAVTQRPITAQAVGEPAAQAPAWKTIPSWYLVARGDRTIPAAAERFMAARARARTSEVDGPHAVHVTDPGVVTRLIEKAAAATR